MSIYSFVHFDTWLPVLWITVAYHAGSAIWGFKKPPKADRSSEFQSLCSLWFWEAFLNVHQKSSNYNMGVSENRLNPIVPNGFADHYPVFKNGYFIGNINPTFSDKPIYAEHGWTFRSRIVCWSAWKGQFCCSCGAILCGYLSRQPSNI